MILPKQISGSGHFGLLAPTSKNCGEACPSAKSRASQKMSLREALFCRPRTNHKACIVDVNKQASRHGHCSHCIPPAL